MGRRITSSATCQPTGRRRWAGTQLMEHSGSGEQALYRFDGVDETGYTVSTDAGWEVAEQPPL